MWYAFHCGQSTVLPHQTLFKNNIGGFHKTSSSLSDFPVCAPHQNVLNLCCCCCFLLAGCAASTGPGRTFGHIALANTLSHRIWWLIGLVFYTISLSVSLSLARDKASLFHSFCHFALVEFVYCYKESLQSTQIKMTIIENSSTKIIIIKNNTKNMWTMKSERDRKSDMIKQHY